MNKKKLRLLAIGLVILLVSSGIATFFILAVGNKNPSADKIRVACVGDSITEGTEYPADLSMLLGANYTVGNFGVGGTTVSLNSQSPYMNTSAFQNATEFQPNIVIIMLGTNDAHPVLEQYNGSFVDDYVKLVAAFQALVSKPKIWIVLPPPVFNNESGISPQYFRLTVIPGIEQAANETHLPVINVYSVLANYSDCFPDGVHPNSEGSKLIANEIYKAII
ncbi:MAG: GDSL-type esterase/lipase family protein [Candidatus Bathyarchaeia archaeon]|jgi:lysophospholipase L1-like esterase